MHIRQLQFRSVLKGNRFIQVNQHYKTEFGCVNPNLKKSLSQHIGSMHNSYKASFYAFKCPIDGCQSSFSGRGILGLHLRIHNNHKIACPFCPYTATIDKQYRAHINIHHKITPIACNMCEKRFGTKSQLNYHVQRDHDGVRVTCPICASTFSTLNVAQTHLKRVHGVHDTKLSLMMRR